MDLSERDLWEHLHLLTLRKVFNLEKELYIEACAVTQLTGMICQLLFTKIPYVLEVTKTIISSRYYTINGLNTVATHIISLSAEMNTLSECSLQEAQLGHIT